MIALSNRVLDAAREDGDPAADRLVAALFSGRNVPPSIARQGYNHLLDVLDRLIEAPGLHLVRDSGLRRELDLYPEDLRAFFEPQRAPDWVDEEKIRLAGRVWAENSLAILFLLYTSSLPFCYLMANGIPVLYETAKLRDKRYVHQRVYETGVFLESVLGLDGIVVDRDLDRSGAARELLEKAARALDASARVEGGARGLRVVSDAEGGDPEGLARRVNALLREPPSAGRRWIWGPGVLATRKVRVLHAAMRHMLLHPGSVVPLAETEEARRAADHFAQATKPFDAERFGVPINQEDMAYTLLTFSLTIVDGLEHLGCRLTAAERAGWLHAWRVVGHVLGVRDDLTSDVEDENRALFQRVHERQAARSEAGVALTSAILEVLIDFFPKRFRLGERLVAVAVRDTVGKENAALLLSDRDAEAARALSGRLLWWIALRVLRLYYFFRKRLLGRSPTLRAATCGLLQRTADGIVQSWRDTYDRRPFYVPASATGSWKRQAGVREDLHRELVTWRTRLFDLAILGTMSLVLGGTLMGLALPVIFVEAWRDHHSAARWIMLSGTIPSVVGAALLGHFFPRLLMRRPVAEARALVETDSPGRTPVDQPRSA